MIHKNLAHHLRGYCHKMAPTLIERMVLLHQPCVGLMNQGGGLQGMHGPFVAEVPTGQLLEFGIDEGHQAIKCFFFAASKPLKTCGYVLV